MLTYFHDTNDMFIMCDGLDKLGGPISATGIAVKVFVVFFSDFNHTSNPNKQIKQNKRGLPLALDTKFFLIR